MAVNFNRNRHQKKNPGAAFFIPTLLYAIHCLFMVSREGLAFTTVSFELWQILPVESLREEPLRSLLYLHSQPPMLNAILALMIKLEAWTSIGLSAWATILMTFVGWGICAIWFAVCRRILDSKWAAAAIVVLLLANPGFYHFQRIYFYPQLLMLETGLLALAALRFSALPSLGRLNWVMFAYSLMAHTWALWHPAFAFVLAGLCMFRVRHAAGSWRIAFKRAFISFALFAALVAPWMAKNKILFNEATFSTWLGLNMRNFALGPNSLWAFAETGEFDRAATRAFYSDRQWERFQNVSAVMKKNKADQEVSTPQTINMNYHAVPPLNRIARDEMIRGYGEKPDEIKRALASNFFFLSLPAALRPYTYDQAAGNYALLDDGFYARVHDLLYYGGWLVPLTRVEMKWERSFGFNLFGLLWFPLSVLGGFFMLGQIKKPRAFVLVLLLSVYCWLVAVVTAIDGAEGARMRWHLEPIFLLMLFATVAELKNRIAFFRTETND